MSRRKKLAALAILGGAALLFAGRWCWGIAWQTVHVSPATTHITGPLRPDGSVDYLAALNARYADGVTPENNAATALLQAVGTANLPFYGEGLPEVLHSPALFALPGGVTPFVQYGTYRKNLAKGVPPDDQMDQWNDELDALGKAPWAREKHPEFAAWLDSLGPALDLVEKGTHRPRFFDPLLSHEDPPTVLGAQSFTMGISRGFAQALAARAMLHLSAGEREEALADSLTIMRLGQLLGQGPSILHRLMAYALFNMGLDIQSQIFAAAPVTPALAADMRIKIAAFGPPPKLGECLDVYERYEVLDQIANMSRFDPMTGKPVNPFSFTLMVPLHFDPVMRTTNQWYDRAVAAAALVEFADRERALEMLTHEVQAYNAALPASKQGALESLSTLMLGFELRRIVRQENYAQQQLNLSLEALDAPAYFAEHPLTADGVAAFAAALPPELFSKKPITAALADGVLTLSCVGPAPLPETTSYSFAATTSPQGPKEFRAQIRLADK